MRYNLDEPPETIPGLIFPNGDILPINAEKALDLYDQLTNGDDEQQVANLNNLQGTEMTNWRFWAGQDENYKALYGLHEAWAESIPNAVRGESIAHLGTFTMLAFIKRSNLLPINFDNFTKDFDAMREYDEDRITQFAEESWSTMRTSYPLLHGALAPMLRHISDINDVSGYESTLALLDASAALPYLMASTTRMTADLHADLKTGLPISRDQRDAA